MLTLEDSMALCDLADDEIAAIAEHEALPQAIAVALGLYLVHMPGGRTAIRTAIRDEIAAARARGDFRHAGTLKLALKHFILDHGMSRSEPSEQRPLV